MVPGEVVVDGRVTREKLDELLRAGAEQQALDFKATYDFSTKHKVEIVKDLLAMMSLPHGGYLVVGVDDDGSIAADQPPLDPRKYDSATLQQKVSKYTASRVSIWSAVHEVKAGVDGPPAAVALIYAAPPPDRLPIVVTTDAVFQVPGGPPAEFILRKGQIVVREGTTTTTLEPRHWPILLSRYTEEVRAEAQRDVNALIARVVEQMGQIERGTGSAAVIDFSMNAEGFTTAADTLIEQNNEARLRRFLVALPRAAAPSEEAREAALDRVFILATSALLYGTPEQLKTIVDAIVAFYRAVPRVLDRTELQTTAEVESAKAWLAILSRLYVLGAVAVRHRRWEALRTIVLNEYLETPVWGYRSWLRHAVTMAARANLLTRDRVRSDAVGSPVLSTALQVAQAEPALSPDLPDVDGELRPVDTLLDSMCQFDILWCLLAQSSTASPQDLRWGSDFYPSSSELDQRRADPAFELVATDPDAREAMFPGMAEREVADVLVGVYDTARRQSWNHHGWWGDLPPGAGRWLSGLGVKRE